MNVELIVYGRTFACGDQARAIAYLDARQVPYRFLDINQDAEAAQRLLGWVGHLSVPTLVVAQPGEVLPIHAPAPLDHTRRIRGQDRQTMITEPDDVQLGRFLQQYNLL